MTINETNISDQLNVKLILKINISSILIIRFRYSNQKCATSTKLHPKRRVHT